MKTKAVLGVVIVVVALLGAGTGYFLLNGDDGDADIKIACGTKNCYEPLWIAEDRGFFDDEGVDVEMKYVDGGGSAITALLNGSVDLTLVGADPAIRMFENGVGGKVVATIETSKSGTMSNDFAYRNDIGIDISDASTLLKEDGTVKAVCGLDTGTAYYSGYLSYLYYQCYDLHNITEDEYKLLKRLKTADGDGGIMHVDFDKQVLAFDDGDVQMLCSGNTVSQAAGKYASVDSGSSMFESLVGGCVIVASRDAIEEKADEIVRVLKAFDRACALIEDSETVDSVAEFCVDYYNAAGWTAEMQNNFFNSYYWDVCTMIQMDDYLEFKASLLGYDGRDYSDRIDTALVERAHQGVELYGGLYIYDSDTGMLTGAGSEE